MQRSLDFYINILGFENADWGNEYFTSVHRDNSSLYLCQGAQGKKGTWIWLGFDGDIFELHQYLLSKGILIKLPPTNFTWGCEMQVEDPDGHTLRLGTERS